MGKFFEGLAEDLILRARFMAWLHAVPDEEPKPGSKPPPRLTRLEKLRKQHQDERYLPDLPDVDGGEQLLEWFWEVGPTEGDGPLTHKELLAWQENTGIELESWQARLLRRMSVEYLAENSRASDPKCEPPVMTASLKPTKAAVAEAMRLSMRGAAKLGDDL